MNEDLHQRLIARQSEAELDRKACKAWRTRGKILTQEAIDVAERVLDRWFEATYGED